MGFGHSQRGFKAFGLNQRKIILRTRLQRHNFGIFQLVIFARHNLGGFFRD